MADPINLQVIDALDTKFQTISGIKGVSRHYLRESEVPGKPFLCFYATEEEAVNRGMETVRRKMWDMLVGVVGYVAGADPLRLGYLLMQDMEEVVEADPTIGVTNVEQARVFARTAHSLGSESGGGLRIVGQVDVIVRVRYRYNAGSP